MVGRLCFCASTTAPDHRDQQEDRRELERQQEVGEEALRDAPRAAVARRRRAGVPTGAPRVRSASSTASIAPPAHASARSDEATPAALADRRSGGSAA